MAICNKILYLNDIIPVLLHFMRFNHYSCDCGYLLRQNDLLYPL